MQASLTSKQSVIQHSSPHLPESKPTDQKANSYTTHSTINVPKKDDRPSSNFDFSAAADSASLPEKLFLLMDERGNFKLSPELPEGYEFFATRGVLEGDQMVGYPAGAITLGQAKALAVANKKFLLAARLGLILPALKDAAKWVADTATTKRADVIFLGNSPKLVKWLVKKDHPAIHSTALNVSKIKKDEKPSPAFTQYLERKLEKLPTSQGPAPHYLIVDFIDQGDSMYQIVNDIRNLNPAAKISVLNLGVGEPKPEKTNKHADYMRNEKGGVLDNAMKYKSQKHLTGRNQLGNEYAQWAPRPGKEDDPGYQFVKQAIVEISEQPAFSEAVTNKLNDLDGELYGGVYKMDGGFSTHPSVQSGASSGNEDSDGEDPSFGPAE